VVSSTPWPHFTPGKDPVPILQEADAKKVVPMNILHTKDIFMGTFVNLEQKASDLCIEKINVHGNEGETIELLVILL